MIGMRMEQLVRSDKTVVLGSHAVVKHHGKVQRYFQVKWITGQDTAIAHVFQIRHGRSVAGRHLKQEENRGSD